MTTQRYFADHALLPTGFASDVLIEVDTQGRISALRSQASAEGATRLGSLLLPGFPNAHSHVFQRLIAGLSERQDDPADDFWSWRELMYAAAGLLDPELLFETACFTYGEMLAAGYTQVSEFHYVHLDPSGRPYAQANAMSQALIDAAARTGISLTLLPTLYQRGGFDERPLAPRQRRFGLELDAFLGLVADLRAQEHQRLRIGMAIHSLRAVAPPVLRALLASPVAQSGPIHIHIAEQTAEVEQCVAAMGATPINWLYRNFDVDARWTLVHATHADPGEIGQIARSRAVLGLCPSTEANLGDGIFPLRDYLDQGGVLAIGSDSHVQLDPLGELRLAEYGQRLRERRRNRCASPRDPEVATHLLRAALAGGAQAADLPVGALAVGRAADWVCFEAPPGFAGDEAQIQLSGAVFAWPPSAPAVFLAGRPLAPDPERQAQHVEGFQRLRARVRAALAG